MTNHVYPQPGDPNDAENFAAWLGREDISNTVERGLEVDSIDYNNGSVDLTAGKVHVYYDGVKQASNNGNPEDREGLSYYGYIDSTTVNFNTSDVNYIYVTLNVDANDSPKIDVNTTGNTPSKDSLLILKVDSNYNTYKLENRDVLENSGALFPGESPLTELVVQWENLLEDEQQIEIFMDNEDTADAITSSSIAMDLVYHITEER
jgi:hypothetical protein